MFADRDKEDIFILINILNKRLTIAYIFIEFLIAISVSYEQDKS